MRALVNFRAGCLPLWIRAFRRSRSFALSFTTYFFTAISFAATNQLRRYVAEPSIRTSYPMSMTWPTRPYPTVVVHVQPSVQPGRGIVKIDPAIVARHWEAAAVEQLSARLRQEGYAVEREASVDGVRPDLVARRPDGTVVLYEVKVPGQRDAAWVSQVAALRDLARAMGGRFHLVLVRP